MRKLLYALLVAGIIISCQKDVDIESIEASQDIHYSTQTNQEIMAQWGWSIHALKDRGDHIYNGAWRAGHTIYYREYKSDGRYTIVLRVPKGNNIAIQGETLIDKLKELDRLTGYTQPVPDQNLEALAQWGWSVHEAKDRGNHIYNGAWREGRTIYHRRYKNDGRYTIVLRASGGNISIQGETLIDKLKELDRLTGYSQPLDYNDPITYVNMFIEDAKKYGHDFSDQTGTITFRDDIWYSGSASDICADGYEIEIHSKVWSDSSRLRKKYLIYHELGHAIMNLYHVCNEDKSLPRQGPYIPVVSDIMFAGSHCWHSNIRNYLSFGSPWLDEDLFNKGVERMFTLTDQRIKPCTTSKGISNHECTFE